MVTSPAADGTAPGDLDPALEARLEWIRAHGGPRPGWTPHVVVAAFVDPIAPLSPPPPWPLERLAPGEPLTLRRLDRAPSGRPEFEVTTRSGRHIGRVTGAPAVMIEAGLAAGVLPQLRVLAVDPTLPPARRLQLALELIVWLAPGEPLAPPAVYDERDIG